MNKTKRDFIVRGTLTVVAAIVVGGCFILAKHAGLLQSTMNYAPDWTQASSTPPKPTLDTAKYDELMDYLAHNPLPATTSIVIASSTATTTIATASTTQPQYLWPVKGTPYPNYGAILPFHRIVAYYGNFHSPAMGVLGQGTREAMLTRLIDQTAAWTAADPTIPAIPALDYIAVAAQAGPGADGMYRLRMSSKSIQEAVDLAKQIDGLVILDVQVGWSTVQQEIPELEEFLRLPNVHLALDPEFALKPPYVPGTKIGTMDAADINFAATYLAGLVNQYDLPPKFLIVHRFTENMVTNYQDIRPLPEVQMVMDMDGFGTAGLKTKVYSQIIYPEPVQFAGLKLFYKNDNVAGGIMSPEQSIKLRPRPIFIQYQ